MISKNLEMEMDDGCNEEVKVGKDKGYRKAKHDMYAEEVKFRRIKRILLSITKPSYTLRLGGENVRAEHRNRLQYLLCMLVRRHNWEEASGVLSVLLKATVGNKSPIKNRIKYGVALEILKHARSDVKATKFRHIFEIWMKKIGSMNMWPTKDRYVVQSEYIIFCLRQGNLDGAYQAALSLMQERQFSNDPMSNLVVGLTFYQLWYSSIPEDLQLQDIDESHVSLESEISRSYANTLFENSEGQCVVDEHEASHTSDLDSDTSVRIDKVSSHAHSVNDSKGSMEVDGSQGEMTPKKFQSQGLYMQSDDDDDNSSQKDHSFDNHADYMEYVSILHSRGLNTWLLPLRMLNSSGNLVDFNHLHKELTNDHYKSAIKHLRLALCMTPPVKEALLPLVQLLLLGNRVHEAMDELEKFGDLSDSTLLLRLKASLLESFDRDSYSKMVACYEETLKKDPTCSHSLSKLISMHHNGEYGPEELVEMIGLHLDGTYAESSMWHEFASCFLKLSVTEEDRMSVCIDETGNNTARHGYSVRFNRVPKMFIEGGSGKSWAFRCRWWLSRHFSPNTFSLETTAGELQLVSYKAAVASHIYGHAFEYVSNACKFLQENDTDLFLFLRMHMLNSVPFYDRNKRL
ncbi:uncharacterized protein LOC124938342 [Impatiens glandulifera]|uniref:uncharacterized protein LOC124938342 n=1 Tax=Impatiens glandulifera TaxID=253017 RepID=UPI001FB06750|nr:uncharacterized protein LOC124938342 [Impatiens glandulifera]